MQLTDSDIRHFDVFGFVIRRAVFSSDEMVAIRAAAESVFDEDCKERPYDGTERQQIQGFVERSDFLSMFVDDPRTLGIVEQLVGNELLWIGSDGNRYVGDTGWHPDGSSSDVLRIKVALYLDPLTATSGALRVIPGSHREILHGNLRTLLQRDDDEITPYGVRASRRPDVTASGFGIRAVDIPAFTLNTVPGDIIFFNQNLWHSSFCGRARRTMFTLNYAVLPTTENGWTFVERMYLGQLEHVRTLQFGRRQAVYGTRFLFSNRAGLQRLVAPLIARNFL